MALISHHLLLCAQVLSLHQHKDPLVHPLLSCFPPLDPQAKKHPFFSLGLTDLCSPMKRNGSSTFTWELHLISQRQSMAAQSRNKHHDHLPGPYDPARHSQKSPPKLLNPAAVPSQGNGTDVQRCQTNRRATTSICLFSKHRHQIGSSSTNQSPSGWELGYLC